MWRQDDDGNTQWDLYGYYEPDGEYVYYEDVESEESTRAFAEVRCWIVAVLCALLINFIFK